MRDISDFVLAAVFAHIIQAHAHVYIYIDIYYSIY